MSGVRAAVPRLTRRRVLTAVGCGVVAGLGLGRRAAAADAPAIVAPPGLGGDDEPETVLTIAGDDSAATTIIPKIAANYLLYRGAGGIEIGKADDQLYTIQVTGTMLNGKQVAVLIRASSSSDGFNLLGSQADIAVTARAARPRELRGGDNLTPAEAARIMRPIALNAIEIIVNKASGIATLSLEDLRDIFSGEKRNWSDVGGNSGTITRYVRPENLLGDLLGTGSNPGHSGVELLRVNSYNQMLTSVARDRQAIGYVAANISYHKPQEWTRDIVVVRFRLGQRLTAAPDEYGIATGDYPLGFPILLYSAPHSDNPEVQSFFAQAEDTESHVIELTTGLAQVTPQLVVPPQLHGNLAEPSDAVTRQAFQDYRDIRLNALRISTTVRFEPHSTNVDSRTRRSFDALASYLRRLDIAPEKLRHAVFSEDTGTPQRNIDISAGLGEVFQRELRARNVHLGKIVALGAAYPLATSKIPLGQRLNRRVETWATP